MSQNFYVRWAIVGMLAVVFFSKFSQWADQVGLDSTMETMLTIGFVAGMAYLTQGYLTGTR